MEIEDETPRTESEKTSTPVIREESNHPGSSDIESPLNANTSQFGRNQEGLDVSAGVGDPITPNIVAEDEPAGSEDETSSQPSTGESSRYMKLSSCAFDVDISQFGKNAEGVDDDSEADSSLSLGVGGDDGGGIDFASKEDFHDVTRPLGTGKKVDKFEEKHKKIMETLRSRYLPCFVSKFANTKPSEVEELAFVKDDTKFLNVVQHIHKLGSEHDGTVRGIRHAEEIYVVLANFDGLFYGFRKLLEILFQNNISEEGFDEPHYKYRPSLTFMVTCLILNASDSNRDFAKKVCDEPGLLELFVWLLRQLKDRHLGKTKINESAESILTNCINAVYNCSVFDENRQRLLEVGGLGVCKPYLDSHEDEIQMQAFLFVANLADEEQSEIFKAKRELLYKLVELMKHGMAAPTRRYLGWSVTELARGLNSLSRNDTNKKLIIDCGAIDALLLVIFAKDAPNEQAEAMQVLWTLSFDIAAKILLKHNKEAIELFDKIVATVPKHPCRKAAKGLLWNLRDSENYHPDDDIPPLQHIMISYQWDAKPLVLKVRDALKAVGYKVWVDVDNMEGSTIHAMAEAVEKSAVVLMCMSHKYKESQNCRSEAEYAYTRKKDIIPLVVETKYKPDGWLGFIKGAKVYYDITNKALFEEKMKKLLEALGSKGKASGPNQQDRKVSMATVVRETQRVKKMKDWDKTQVTDWLMKSGVDREKFSKVNGSQLHFLQRMYQRAPEYYYSFLERNLHRLNDFSDFTALTNALEETLDHETEHSSHF